MILLPSPDSDGYTLKGYMSCFPNGFDTFTKLGQKLRTIHTPVPRNADKLEKSMDGFFDRIEVGRYVKRANWTVTTRTQNCLLPLGTTYMRARRRRWRRCIRIGRGYDTKRRCCIACQKQWRWYLASRRICIRCGRSRKRDQESSLHRRLRAWEQGVCPKCMHIRGLWHGEKVQRLI